MIPCDHPVLHRLAIFADVELLKGRAFGHSADAGEPHAIRRVLHGVAFGRSFRLDERETAEIAVEVFGSDGARGGAASIAGLVGQITLKKV